MQTTMPRITPPLSWGDLAEIQAIFDANFDPSRFGDIPADELDEKEGEPSPQIRYL